MFKNTKGSSWQSGTEAYWGWSADNNFQQGASEAANPYYKENENYGNGNEARVGYQMVSQGGWTDKSAVSFGPQGGKDPSLNPTNNGAGNQGQQAPYSYNYGTGGAANVVGTWSGENSQYMTNQKAGNVSYADNSQGMAQSSYNEQIGGMMGQQSGGNYSMNPSGGNYSMNQSVGNYSMNPSGGNYSMNQSGGNYSMNPSGGNYSMDQSGGNYSMDQSGKDVEGGNSMSYMGGNSSYMDGQNAGNSSYMGSQGYGGVRRSGQSTSYGDRSRGRSRPYGNTAGAGRGMRYMDSDVVSSRPGMGDDDSFKGMRQNDWGSQQNYQNDGSYNRRMDDSKFKSQNPFNSYRNDRYQTSYGERGFRGRGFSPRSRGRGGGRTRPPFGSRFRGSTSYRSSSYREESLQDRLHKLKTEMFDIERNLVRKRSEDSSRGHGQFPVKRNYDNDEESDKTVARRLIKVRRGWRQAGFGSPYRRGGKGDTNQPPMDSIPDYERMSIAEMSRQADGYSGFPLRALYCRICDQPRFSSVFDYFKHVTSIKHKDRKRSVNSRISATYQYLLKEAKLAYQQIYEGGANQYLVKKAESVTFPDYDSIHGEKPECEICDVKTVDNKKVIKDHLHIKECWHVHRYVNPFGCCGFTVFTSRMACENHGLSLDHLAKRFRYNTRQKEIYTKEKEKLRKIKDIVKYDDGTESNPEHRKFVVDESGEKISTNFSNPVIGKLARLFMRMGNVPAPEEIVQLIESEKMVEFPPPPEKIYAPFKIHSLNHRFEPSNLRINMLCFDTEYECGICKVTLGKSKESVIQHCSSVEHYEKILLKKRKFTSGGEEEKEVKKPKIEEEEEQEVEDLGDICEEENLPIIEEDDGDTNLIQDHYEEEHVNEALEDPVVQMEGEGDEKETGLNDEDLDYGECT